MLSRGRRFSAEEKEKSEKSLSILMNHDKRDS